MAKSSFTTAGFYSKRAQKLNGPPNGEPWLWLTLSLVESEVFRNLSLHANRALFRIIIEHAHQGGKENGRLKVTTRDLKAYGVNWRQVSASVRELERAGLVKVTFKGRKVYGTDKGESRQFALTWLPIIEPDNLVSPTNEWKRARPAAAPGTKRRAPKLRLLNGGLEAVDIEGEQHGGDRELRGALSNTGEADTDHHGGGRH